MESINIALAQLAAMSNKYGANADFVLAGGGNTSFKNSDRLWIKGSGTSLATIRAEDFVVMDRKKLENMWTAQYPEDEAAREEAVLADMMAARVPAESRRPSVETLLHELFPQNFILHVHPALVNGLTCSQEGKTAMQRLLPEAVWVDACKPGYILAVLCKEQMQAYKTATGKDCALLFLENHGIFFAGNTVEQIDALALQVMGTLSLAVAGKNAAFSVAAVASVTAELKKALGGAVRFAVNPQVLAYDPTTKSLSPDHIVYAKACQLQLGTVSDVAQAVSEFTAKNGYSPRIVFAENLGMFSCGETESIAATAEAVMLDAIRVTAYAASFGGVKPMPDHLIDFICNWEVERYRSQVSLSDKKA